MKTPGRRRKTEGFPTPSACRPRSGIAAGRGWVDRSGSARAPSFPRWIYARKNLVGNFGIGYRRSRFGKGSGSTYPPGLVLVACRFGVGWCRGPCSRWMPPSSRRRRVTPIAAVVGELLALT
jgi:hypothetical protein